jgi:hypothetical protein
MHSPATKSGIPERFTVDQANRMLPLVRAIVVDLRLQQTLVDEMTNRLNRLGGRSSRKSEGATDSEFTDEIKEFRRDLESERNKLEAFRHELTRLGILPRTPVGHCDFPSQIDGCNVELCWTPDEPEVLFWHLPGADFRDRRPLVAEAGAGFDDHAGDRSWNEGPA